MIALCIETATTATALGLSTGSTTVEEVVDDDRRHTEALGPAVSQLLERHGLAPRAVDLVVVDVGPGLFTGLRVGIAYAKGLCLATRATLVGVESTEVLAAAAFERGIEGTVVCAVDARRGEVFAARYERGELGPRRIGATEVLAPPALAERLCGPATVVGDGAARYGAILERHGVVVLDDLCVPAPASALRLVAARRDAGTADPDVATVRPVYLREADAVANFEVRGVPA